MLLESSSGHEMSLDISLMAWNEYMDAFMSISGQF